MRREPLFVEDEREPIPGYDFTFAPYRPIDPEYREVCMPRLTAWLVEWAPMVGSWPQ